MSKADDTMFTPTKADDTVSVSSEGTEGTPQKPDVKRTRLTFEWLVKR